MIAKDIVNQVITDFLASTELYLVDLIIAPDNRISIEIDSFKGVSLDDCVALNKFIESRIDREVEDYELEVSSAGLTEPFKVLKQYEKNVGREVEVLTKEGKKYSGILLSFDPDAFSVEVVQTVKQEGAKRKITVKSEMKFSYNDIKTTKLIIRFK